MTWVLSKDLERAEQEKNHLNEQLLQAQNEKVNIEGEKGKLMSQKASDIRVLGELNMSVNEMNIKLNNSTTTKVQTNEAICILTSRIEQLTRLLQTTDKQLKILRETKTQILSILTTLKTIHSKKLEDLREMEEAGEDVGDILEDLDGINEAIKESVDTLITITCGGSLMETDLDADVERILKDTPRKCNASEVTVRQIEDATKRVLEEGNTTIRTRPNSDEKDELK